MSAGSLIVQGVYVNFKCVPFTTDHWQIAHEAEELFSAT